MSRKKQPTVDDLFDQAEPLLRKTSSGYPSVVRFAISVNGQGKLSGSISTALRRLLADKGINIQGTYATLRATSDGMLFFLFTASKQSNSMRVTGNQTAYMNLACIDYEIPEGEWLDDEIHILPKKNAFGVQLKPQS